MADRRLEWARGRRRRRLDYTAVMSLFALSSSALALGFLHGLGGDHLMAIAALSVDGRRTSSAIPIVRTAVGFAFGHTIVLAAGAAIAIGFGVVLPGAVSSGAERAGGAILVALGALGLWSLLSGRAYTHIHAESDGRRRLHLHVGGADRHPAGAHRHSLLPTVMGAVFAVSSLRALMLLQPFGAGVQSLTMPVVLLLVALFGLGILLSMSLFGVLLARLLSLGAVEALGRAAAAFVASASILVGVYWLIG
jgi:hypothetical protein